MAAFPSLGCNAGIYANPSAHSAFATTALSFCSVKYSQRRTPCGHVRLRQTSLIAGSKLPPSSKGRCNLRLHSRKGADEEDFITTLIEKTASTFSRPILAGFLDPPLALGYPIVLLTGIWILPFVTSILLVVCFGFYAWLGRSAVLSDWEDEEDAVAPVDLLALGAATVTSGLLTPFDSSVDDGVTQAFASNAMIVSSSPSWLGSMVIISLIAALLLVSSKVDLRVENDEDSLRDDDGAATNERALMNLWDQSLEGQDVDVDIQDKDLYE
jgi:hypothetical protein